MAGGKGGRGSGLVDASERGFQWSWLAGAATGLTARCVRLQPTASCRYSFGVLLVFLTTRRHTERRGEWRVPTAPDDCPPDVVALIQACMSPDPQDRPTAAEAMQRLTDA